MDIVRKGVDFPCLKWQERSLEEWSRGFEKPRDCKFVIGATDASTSGLVIWRKVSVLEGNLFLENTTLKRLVFINYFVLCLAQTDLIGVTQSRENASKSFFQYCVLPRTKISRQK